MCRLIRSLKKQLKRLRDNKSEESEESKGRTDNKVDLLLNITLEYEANKTQENGRVDGLLSGHMQKNVQKGLIQFAVLVPSAI